MDTLTPEQRLTIAREAAASTMLGAPAIQAAIFGGAHDQDATVQSALRAIDLLPAQPTGASGAAAPTNGDEVLRHVREAVACHDERIGRAWAAPDIRAGKYDDHSGVAWGCEVLGHYLANNPAQPTPSATADAGDRGAFVPASALAWLFGEGPDANGRWFGEWQEGDPIPKGAFWWRNHFRDLIEAHPAPASPGQGAVVGLDAEALARIVFFATEDGIEFSGPENDALWIAWKDQPETKPCWDAAEAILARLAEMERERDEALRELGDAVGITSDASSRIQQQPNFDGSCALIGWVFSDAAEGVRKLTALTKLAVSVRDRPDAATARAEAAEARAEAAEAEIGRLKAALTLCLQELEWQTTASDRCGDPGCECPLQDSDAPHDGHRIAREAARAALEQPEASTAAHTKA